MPKLAELCTFDPQVLYNVNNSNNNYSLSVSEHWRFIINTKKSIDYKSLDLKKQKNLLYKLGFNLTSNRIQGNKYIREDNNILSVEWTRHDQNDVNSGLIYNYTSSGKEFFIPININSVIKKHYSTSQSSNRKYHPVSKLKGTNRLRIDEYTASAAQKIKHVHGISMHPSRSVICFDIDSHPEGNSRNDFLLANNNANHTFKCLLKELNYHNPIFTEISQLGGIHVYYCFDQPISDDEISIWLKYFNEKYSTSLETSHTNKVFQLPDSVFYCPIYFTNLDNQNISFEYYTSTESYQNDVLQYNSPLSYNNFLSIFLHEKRFKNIKVPLYNNTYKKKSDFNKDHFYFGSGYRVDTIFRSGLGFFAFKNSNLNFDLFKNEIISYDMGSKDFSSKNSNNIMFSVFSWIKDHYNDNYNTNNSSNSILSNDDFLTSSSINYISILSNLLNDRYFSYNYKKCIHDNKKTLNHLLLFIFGRISFEQSTNFKRKVSKFATLTSEKKSEYETGYIFYREIRDYIKDSNNITLDIRKVWNTLMSALVDLKIFKEYKHHCSIPGYEIQKRWLLLTNNDINSILTTIINNILQTRDNANFELKEKIYIIDGNSYCLNKKNSFEYRFVRTQKEKNRPPNH